MARPSKASPERKSAILDAIGQGMTKTGAAAMADISRQTFYRWMDEDATFRDEVEKAISRAESRFLLRVTQAAQSGTWQAAAWWLERRMPEHYALRNKSQVEVSGPDGGAIPLSPVLAGLSDEQIAERVKQLEAEVSPDNDG